MRIIKSTLKYLLLLVVFILIILPYAGKYSAIHYLKSEKNIESNIDDLSINFLTGKIGLEGVHLYGENMGELHLGEFQLDVSLLALFKKNILIESIVLKDFSSNVSELDKAWNVGGVHIPLAEKVVEEPEIVEEESKPLDWGYGIRSIRFSNINVDVSSQYTDSKFVLNNLKVKDALSWFPDSASGLELDLSVNGQSFTISGDANPFMQEPLVKTRVEIDNIQLRPFLKSVKDLPFDEANVALFADFEMQVELKNEQMQLGINGEYGLRDVYLKDKVREINLSKLAWSGEQHLVLPKQGSKNINLDGVVSLENIDIADSENNARIVQEKISLAGQYEIKLDESTDVPNIKASTVLALNKLDIYSLDGKSKLISFDNWNIGKINVNSVESVVVKNSELNNLVLLKVVADEKLPAVTTLKKFIISDIKYQSDSVEISKVEFRHLNADVRLDKNGAIPALDVMSPASDEANAEVKVAANSDATKNLTQEKPDEQKKKFGMVINEIVVNSNSNIRFIDNSVIPVFDTKIHDLKLQINNIDSENPQNSAAVDFGMKIDEYGNFSLKGKLQPFTEKLNANLVANLDSLELVPLSSYAGKFAGINIKRGTLNLDADIQIKKDILDVKNTFFINQLNVESDGSEAKSGVFKDMPMPLDLTLDVLRDKNNIIKLDIPVKGDVNNPDFRLQDVYNTAMAKAMKFAATHYLMQAVQPLGLVITAGKLIGKAMVPKFDPLIFDAGSTKISEVNQQHIKKLAKILQDKDKLRFTICGTATESDWKRIQVSKKKMADSAGSVKNAEVADAQVKDTKVKGQEPIGFREQVLLKLSNDRTKLVKKQFVDVHKIDPKRLFSCNGKIEKDEEEKIAVPAVEITL